MQNIIVFLIFLSAVGYLGWRAWVSLRRPAQGGCAKGCGCGEPEKLVSNNKTLELGKKISA